MSRSFRNAAIWAISGKYLSFSIVFVTSVIVARFYLTPEEVGLFSIAFAATTLIAVLQEFGLNRFLVGEPDLTPEKLRIAYSLSLVIAWSISFFVMAIALPVSVLYADERIMPLMLIVGASYLFMPFGNIPIALRQRALDFKSDFLTEVGTTMANAVVTISLASHGWSALALAWGAFAQQFARALISQLRNGWIFPWPLQFRNSKSMLRFGGGSTVLQILDATNARAPDLLIGALVGYRAVGLYSRASGLAVQLINLTSGAVNSVFYPAFAKLRDSGEPLAEPYVRITAGYTATVWAAMAGLAVASYPLINTLYGPKWIDVAPLLAWLAMAEMLLVCLPLPVQIPILLGRLKSVVYRAIISTASLILLMLVGLQWGIKGAAISYCAFGFTLISIFGPFLQGLIGFKWRDMGFAYLKSASAAFAAVVPLLIGYTFWAPRQEMGFGSLLVHSLAGVVAWAIMLIILKHPLADSLKLAFADLRTSVERRVRAR